MTIADRIRAGRRASGFTQEALAHAVGVSPRTVRRWEAGQSRPRNAHLIRLARVLGVGVGELS